MKFERSLRIAAPRELLFDLTQDYVRRLEWDPFLSAARLLGAEEAGDGVTAICDDRRGLSMTVTYVSYTRPEVAAVKMVRGPFFLSSFAGSWRFAPGESGTLVTFKYYYTVKPVFRPFGWLIERIFRTETDERLTALRAFAE